MRVTVDFNSVSFMSMGEVSRDPISLPRANSDKLRAPWPEDAACSEWYSSSVRRKIKILLRGLMTAMVERAFREDHIPIDLHASEWSSVSTLTTRARNPGCKYWRFQSTKELDARKVRKSARSLAIRGDL
jgi:hypothetical protein